MTQKMFLFGLIWFFVVVAYITMAFMMPAIGSISSDAATALSATSNMTNYPGTLEAVQSSNVWLWFIPGTVGLVACVYVAIKK